MVPPYPGRWKEWKTGIQLTYKNIFIKGNVHMNDENKMPVPDEAQAFPAHAEDDIATLEREARAKREAELLNAQDDEEKDPVQPAVNKLKKRKRGKATAFLAIVAVTLIFWHGVVTGFIAISCGSLRKKRNRTQPRRRTKPITGSVTISVCPPIQPKKSQSNRITARAARGEQGRWLRPPRQNSTKPASLFAVMVRPPHRTR